MKKKCLFIVSLLLLNFNNNSFANDKKSNKIAVIDLQIIENNSLAVNDILKQLNEKQKLFQTELSQDENKIQEKAKVVHQ